MSEQQNTNAPEVWITDWFDGKHLNEVAFCEAFLKEQPMVCVGGSFFSVEGRISDEEGIKKQIYDMLRPYIHGGLAKKSGNLLDLKELEKRGYLQSK